MVFSKKFFFLIFFIITAFFIGCGSDTFTTTSPTVTPTPLPPGSTVVEGQVFNVKNNVIPGAYLVFYNLTQILSGSSDSTKSVTSDALGNYLFDGLTPCYGRIEMWKSKSDYNSSPLNPSGSVNLNILSGINRVNLIEGQVVAFPSVIPTPTPTATGSPVTTATPTAVNTPLPGYPMVTDASPSYDKTNGLSPVTFKVKGYNFGTPSNTCTVKLTEVKGLGSTPSVTLTYGSEILFGQWNDIEITCINVTLDTGKYFVQVTEGSNKTTSDKVYYVKGNADYDITVSKK